MVVMVVVAAFSLGGLDYLLDPFVFSDGTSTVVVVILGLAFVALYIPVLAATFRRFHDRDLSGWWVIGLIILGNVPVFGFVASIAMLVIQALKGTEGRNRFGEDPLLPTGSADVFT